VGLLFPNLNGFYLEGIDIIEIYISNTILSLSSNKNKSSASTNLSNLSLNSDLNSPIFTELISILSNNPINQETQLKIEQILQNQGLVVELEKRKLKLLSEDKSIAAFKKITNI